jgi:threonylcarbamoyladenosine tRNA methylthiotransferase MtaB
MSDTEIITFGCRLNAFESEVMLEHARAAGLGDAVVVNTCAVTSEAVRQAAQAIRKLRRERPGVKIIVTGCAAQLDPERFAAMPEVDHVIGNESKRHQHTFEIIGQAEAGGGDQRVIVTDIMEARETAGHLISGFGGRARAFIEIQNGCDHRCTFCIIPFARGPSRSAPAGVVVDQIRTLVERGYREVVLTGVDITSYGCGLPGGITLGQLVRKILKLVPELPRLRLSSIDTIEADPALMKALAEEERLTPHLHLSLQAGDDLILKRMKRRHSRAQAIEFCETVRRLRPDAAFGADLIAGFPTETEEMFDNSLRLVDDCGLTFLHVFPFSPRPDTPAARMPQVARDVVKDRAQRLRAAGQRALDRFLGGQLGRTVDALMENENVGRTPQFAELRLTRSAAPRKAGDIISARVTGSVDGVLLGEAIS